MAMQSVLCPRCGHTNPHGTSACCKCGAAMSSGPGASAPKPSGSQPRRDSHHTFHKNEVVANRYTVLAAVGRGGMGAIYRVYDNVLKEQVALKTLLPQFSRDQLVVDRFYNEARIARGLSHPNIVRVHDIGITGDIMYISMEYLQGRSLRDVLDKVPAGQRMPVGQVLEILDQVCIALEYAHKFTVHRDIKPENIMLLPDGSIRLMDFGISKLVTNSGLTATSVVMGTPRYMAPEQLKDSSKVDARADIYSLGVMLYEMLTGVLPTGVLKPVSQLRREVPPALDPIIDRCVEPEPGNRYPSATALREAIRPIRTLLSRPPQLGPLAAPEAEAPAAPAASPRQRPEEKAVPASTGRPLVALAYIALILFIAGSVFMVFNNQRRQARQARQTEPRAVAVATPESQQFALLAARVERASRKLPDLSGDPQRQAVLEEGRDLWSKAQRANEAQSPLAVSLGLDALQRFVAVLAWPDGMVFVPPGPVPEPDAERAPNPESEGFFIGATEVPVGAYNAFLAEQAANGAPWTAPPGFDAGQAELPVTNVSFYDAQAYAASVGAQLPTETQWARAAYGAPGAPSAYPWGDEWSAEAVGEDAADAEGLLPVASVDADLTAFGCHDMAGSVSEWTRPADENSTVTFNVMLPVRGGNADTWRTQSMTQRLELPFEGRDPYLGFRCVKALPSTWAEIDALLE